MPSASSLLQSHIRELNKYLFRHQCINKFKRKSLDCDKSLQWIICKRAKGTECALYLKNVHICTYLYVCIFVITTVLKKELSTFQPTHTEGLSGALGAALEQKKFRRIIQNRQEHTANRQNILLRLR